MAVLFISIDRVPFLLLTLDIIDSLVALAITPGFYLHHVPVEDQDPACGNLLADLYAT